MTSNTSQQSQILAKIGKFVKAVQETNCFSFDFETDSLNPYTAKLVGISLSWWEDLGKFERLYVPVGHEQPENPILGWDFAHEGTWIAHEENLDWQIVREMLAPVFRNPMIRKVAHNAKYDLAVAFFNDLIVDGPVYDTLLAEWILNSDKLAGLKATVLRVFDYQMMEFDHLTTYRKGRKTYTAPISRIPLDKVTEYAADDAYWTLRLYGDQQTRFMQEPILHDLFKMENDLMRVVLEMEMTGVLVDTDYLRNFSAAIKEELRNIETTLHGYLLEGVGSPMTVANWFTAKGVNLAKYKTPGKNGFSVDGDVLKAITTDSKVGTVPKKVAADVLTYRGLAKLDNTYTSVIPLFIHPKTGRVHARFNQRGAATGRFASDSPNLQNQPAQPVTVNGTEYHMRRAFVAPEGWKLVSVDYSQIELRVLAHLSGDPALMDVFWQGRDAHTSTAAAIFHISESAVTKNQRTIGKTMNFAMAYGGGAGVIARRTDLKWNECQELHANFKNAFPGIEAYAKRMATLGSARGYVETILGRRIYIKNNRGEIPYTVAVNAPIQGSAADIIKLAMVKISNDEYLKEYCNDWKMVMQVHDELDLYVRDGRTDIVQRIASIMETAYRLNVPVLVDAEWGPTWYGQVDVPGIVHTEFVRDEMAELI